VETTDETLLQTTYKQKQVLLQQPPNSHQQHMLTDDQFWQAAQFTRTKKAVCIMQDNEELVVTILTVTVT